MLKMLHEVRYYLIEDRWSFGTEKCFCFSPKLIHPDMYYSLSAYRSKLTLCSPKVQLETLAHSDHACDFIYLFKGMYLQTH